MATGFDRFYINLKKTIISSRVNLKQASKASIRIMVIGYKDKEVGGIGYYLKGGFSGDF